MNRSPLVLEVSIPEYKPGEKPDRLVVGPKLDSLLEQHFADKKIVIRCIGSQDHPGKTLDQLADIVLQTGTDKYDKQRQGYGYGVSADKEAKIDFFGTLAEIAPNAKVFATELLDDFYHGALGDRGYPIRIDLVIIYDPKKLKAVEHLYGDDVDETDGFVFRGSSNKQEALLGIIKIL